MQTIKDDTNLQLSEKLASLAPSSRAAQTQAQQDAATTVVDARSMTPQWQTVSDNLVDPNTATNSRQSAKASKINPTQGFMRQPDMPKLSSLKSIKVNY